MTAIVISAPGLDAVRRGFERAPEYTRQELLKTMLSVTQSLQGQAADAMPSVSGLTRASITSDAFSTPAGVLGVVGSASVAAVAVEFGTKPHMPPVQPLVSWVQEKLGVPATDARRVAFLVARKIARAGTPAQRPFKKTLDRHWGDITREFENCAARIAARLAADGNGGAA